MKENVCFSVTGSQATEPIFAVFPGFSIDSLQKIKMGYRVMPSGLVTKTQLNMYYV